MQTTTIKHNLAAVFAAAILFTGLAHAASLTWDTNPGTVGAGDGAITGGTGTWDTTNGNWTDDGGDTNVAWNSGTPDSATFAGSASGLVTLGEDITADSLTFNTAGYTIGTAAGTEQLILNGSRTITLNADGQINSLLNYDGGITFDTGSNTLTIAGPAYSSWSVPQGKTHVLTQGTLELDRTGSYFGALSGSLTVGDGTNTATVRFLQDKQLLYGGLTTIHKNGTVDINGFSNNPYGSILLKGGGGLGGGSLAYNTALRYEPQEGGVPATVSADLALNTHREIRVFDDPNLDIELEITGNITGANAGITTTARTTYPTGGALRLSGSNNNYQGESWIDGLTVYVNGTHSDNDNWSVGMDMWSAVTSGNDTDAMVGGTGTIGLASGATFSVGDEGTVSPGDPDNPIGTLTIGTAENGNTVFFLDDATLVIDVAADGTSDTLAVIGDLDLSGTGDILQISDVNLLNGTDEYTIMTYTGNLLGGFDVMPTLPGPYRYEIGNGAIVLAIPEPTSISLLVLGGLALLRRRRR